MPASATVVKELRRKSGQSTALTARITSESLPTPEGSIKILSGLYSSSTLREAEEAKVTNLVGGVTLHKQRIETLYNGTGVCGNIKNLWNNHTVQWVDLPASNNGVKIVTWSKGNTNGWQKATVKQTMQDFESKHPGWIVIAGINGDFFDNSAGGTSEPTGFYVQDGGEVFRPNHAGAGYRLTLGWNNDGSYIIGRPTHDEKMTLHVGDKEFTVNSVNSAPAAEGVTLLTVDASSAYDLTGYTVYKVDNGAYRVASGNKKLFVKGYVVSLEDSLSSVKCYSDFGVLRLREIKKNFAFIVPLFIAAMMLVGMIANHHCAQPQILERFQKFVQRDGFIINFNFIIIYKEVIFI